MKLFDKKQSFTLIELLMVTAIIAIIGATGFVLTEFFVQSMVFVPNSLLIDMTASDITEILCEGNLDAGGLRFSRQITSADDTDLTYEDSDKNTVMIRLNSGAIQRNINSTSWQDIPYYFGDNVTISEITGTTLFQYYDIADTIITTPVSGPNLESIKKIEIQFIITTGSGDFEDWQSQKEIKTCVYINTYN